MVLALLAFASGVTDVLSFLGLQAVFTSAMTGNTAFLGLEAGQGKFDAAARSCAALGGFVAGVACGAAPRRPGRYGALFRVLMLEAAFLAVFSGLWVVRPELDQGWAIYLLIVLSAAGMGAQSVAARLINLPGIPTVVFTSTLTSIVIAATEAVLRRAALPFEAWRQIAVFCAYLCGTLLAGVISWRSLGALVPLPLGAVIIALALEYSAQRR